MNKINASKQILQHVKETPEWGKGSENNCNPSTKLRGQLISHPIFSKSYL